MVARIRTRWIRCCGWRSATRADIKRGDGGDGKGKGRGSEIDEGIARGPCGEGRVWYVCE